MWITLDTVGMNVLYYACNDRIELPIISVLANFSGSPHVGRYNVGVRLNGWCMDTHIV